MWFANQKNDQANAMKAGLNVVSSAVMMVDRDFVVTYQNAASQALLREHVEHFRSLWPTFDPDRMVGVCIDMFHKNPAHQRRMLSEPSKLPYKTEITVGPLRIALHVHANYDAKGRYCGNILEWSDITQIRANELQNAEYRGMFDAINKAQAVIEFSMDGRILNANENFLKTLGYSLDEIKGQHHSMFVDPSHRQSPEYRAVLGQARPRRIRRRAVQAHRQGRQGGLDPGQLQPDLRAGRQSRSRSSNTPPKSPRKSWRLPISKASSPRSARPRPSSSSRWTARSSSANDNFLKTLGYSLSEIAGQHHAMFVEPAIGQSPEYRLFWEKLGRGEYDAGQYKRIGKGGKEVWIQASYNPILGPNGKPFKVVKYATDVTEQVRAMGSASARRLQQTQDVVEAAKANDLYAAHAARRQDRRDRRAVRRRQRADRYYGGGRRSA